MATSEGRAAQLSGSPEASQSQIQISNSRTSALGPFPDDEDRPEATIHFEPEGPSRWKAFLENVNPAPALQNSGSVARDHLANERTWLAYLRTSLALASAGVALVQLFTISEGAAGKLRRFVRPLGAVAVAVGLTLLLIGTSRYFRIQASLKTGLFPPARWTVGFLSGSLVIIVAIVFAFLVGLAH